MRLPVKKILAVLAGAVVLLVLARGLWIAGYQPASSDNYLWGAFHVHSTMSDGLAPLDEIAAHATDARVGFVMLSDHGPPHRDAVGIDETIGGVRFIGGSEVGLPEGHLIVSDVDAVFDYHLPPFPPDAVGDIARWGGLSVLTYPEDPTHRWLYWEEDFAPDGIEIINVTSYFRASSHWEKLAWAIFSTFNSYYYVTSFESPAYALERWDELLTRGRVSAYYAANAHGGFPVTEELIVGIPSYRTAFSYVGLGIDHAFAADPMEAVRQGRFFAIVRGAGEPNRFEFVHEDGRLRVELDVDVDALTPRIVLKRDGAIVAETGELELVVDATTPGIYRAEIYLDDHLLLAPDVPWILANPILVGVEAPRPRVTELSCEDVHTIDPTSWHVETDPESAAVTGRGPSGELTLTYELSKSTEARVDRWVALALREPLDLTGYRGVRVTGAAPAPMRYWIEVRAGETGHYATFKVDEASSARAIPWSRFYPTVGDARPIPLADIDAVFITVNTMSSVTGFASTLTLSQVGWCR